MEPDAPCALGHDGAPLPRPVPRSAMTHRLYVTAGGGGVSYENDSIDASNAAVKIGCRHFDAAQAYGNEREVGEGGRGRSCLGRRPREALRDLQRRRGLRDIRRGPCPCSRKRVLQCGSLPWRQCPWWRKAPCTHFENGCTRSLVTCTFTRAMHPFSICVHG
ncbi:hypothetical protein IV77_GL000885 [Olsenella uli DSM 7084]|nr:hypothetical protein IV77_GL000885 [Olsenella uli DSM 7084]